MVKLNSGNNMIAVYKQILNVSVSPDTPYDCRITFKKRDVNMSVKTLKVEVAPATVYYDYLIFEIVANLVDEDLNLGKIYLNGYGEYLLTFEIYDSINNVWVHDELTNDIGRYAGTNITTITYNA